ncbi:hypothetical protein VTK26DRAFT_3441 [Humicola hyalothermophila]
MIKDRAVLSYYLSLSTFLLPPCCALAIAVLSPSRSQWSLGLLLQRGLILSLNLILTLSLILGLILSLILSLDPNKMRVVFQESLISRNLLEPAPSAILIRNFYGVKFKVVVDGLRRGRQLNISRRQDLVIWDMPQPVETDPFDRKNIVALNWEACGPQVPEACV